MKIKVMQLNVWNGGKLFENVEAFLKVQQADIYFFQEVFNGSGDIPRSFRTLEEFQKILPNYFFDFTKSFGDIGPYGAIDRGNAVFSKFPILEADSLFIDFPYKVFDEQQARDFEKTPRVLEHVQINIEKKLLDLFNVHGIWGKHGGDTERRVKMAHTIVKNLEGKEHIIVSGDFNLNPDTETVRIIEKKVKSVFGDSLVSTFNMKHKTDPGYATARVDMMFVSPSIQVLSKDCPQVDVSDHLPLVVELEV